VSANLSITIVPPPLHITTLSLPNGNELLAYSAQVAATGGTIPYVWSASGLPTGLTINSTTGVIGGTPVMGTAGNYTVNVTAKDSSSPQLSASANFPLTIIPPTGTNFVTITGGTVGQNLEIPLIITLSPASSGNVQILSNNPAVITLAAHALDVGTGSLTIPVSAGTTTFSVFAQGMASSGSATVTASLSGYSSGQSAVTAAPSAFVLAGPNGIGGSFITGQNASSQLTVSSAQLDSSGNVVQIQPVAGGHSPVATLTIGDPNLGTVTPSAVTFTGGMSNATNIQFTAGSSVVSSTITVSEPAGFITPAGGANVLAVTITNLGMSCAGVTVGQNLENFTTCNLTGAAQSDTTVTLTSNDPTKLLLSTDPTVAGSVVITRTIRAGGSTTAPFYVYGLGNSGTATFSASGGGLTATGTVTLAKSGFVLAGPFGLGSDILATAGGAPLDVVVQTALLDASGNYLDTQALAGGLTASVTVTSSNTAVGTISGSPAVITGANNTATVQFQAASSGTTVLTAVTPAGYATPTQYATINATVGQPKIVLDDGNTIGKNLQRTGTIILLGAAAPTNGLVVNLAAAGMVSLSTTGTDAGFTSINVTIPAGKSSGTYFMYGMDVTGTATITATAPGYKTGTGTEFLTPSGIVIGGPQGVGVGLSTFNTPLASGNQPLSISTAQLDTAGNFVQTQALAGSASLTVSLTNTDATVGTVPATVAITPGTDTGTVQFHPLKVGTTTIGVVQPGGGFTASTDGTASLKINVH
jgi:hypothetical protein